MLSWKPLLGTDIREIDLTNVMRKSSIGEPRLQYGGDATTSMFGLRSEGPGAKSCDWLLN